jgi:hypothetical protein
MSSDHPQLQQNDRLDDQQYPTKSGNEYGWRVRIDAISMVPGTKSQVVYLFGKPDGQQRGHDDNQDVPWLHARAQNVKRGSGGYD